MVDMSTLSPQQAAFSNKLGVKERETKGHCGLNQCNEALAAQPLDYRKCQATEQHPKKTLQGHLMEQTKLLYQVLSEPLMARLQLSPVPD